MKAVTGLWMISFGMITVMGGAWHESLSAMMTSYGAEALGIGLCLIWIWMRESQDPHEAALRDIRRLRKK